MRANLGKVLAVAFTFAVAGATSCVNREQSPQAPSPQQKSEEKTPSIRRALLMRGALQTTNYYEVATVPEHSDRPKTVVNPGSLMVTAVTVEDVSTHAKAAGVQLRVVTFSAPEVKRYARSRDFYLDPGEARALSAALGQMVTAAQAWKLHPPQNQQELGFRTLEGLEVGAIYNKGNPQLIISDSAETEMGDVFDEADIPKIKQAIETAAAYGAPTK
jgi:hypothetical protein